MMIYSMIVMVVVSLFLVTVCSSQSPECRDHPSCSTYTTQICYQAWIKTNCKKLCSLCSDENTRGSVYETTTFTTTTTAAVTMYPPEITSYPEGPYSPGQTFALICKSKNPENARGSLMWNISRDGIETKMAKVADDSIQLDIFRISAKHDGLQVTCLEKSSNWETQDSITIKVNTSLALGEWEMWSTCSATCGEGSRTRRRTCTSTEATCPRETTETVACHTSCCVPQHGEWSAWREWSSCSQPCGPETRTRSRTCVPNDCGQYCEGNSSEEQSCQHPTCGSWGKWSGWSSCSATCGSGTMSRSRTCTPPYAMCLGDRDQEEPCKLKDCCVPKDGQWSVWGYWSSCSQHCGNGTRTRSRTCTQPNDCGRPCEGNSSLEEACQVQTCEMCTNTRSDCHRYKQQCSESWVKRDCKKMCSMCLDEEKEQKGNETTTVTTSTSAATLHAECTDNLTECHHLVSRCGESFMQELCRKTCSGCREHKSANDAASEDTQSEEGSNSSNTVIIGAVVGSVVAVAVIVVIVIVVIRRRRADPTYASPKTRPAPGEEHEYMDLSHTAGQPNRTADSEQRKQEEGAYEVPVFPPS